MRGLQCLLLPLLLQLAVVHCVAWWDLRLMHCCLVTSSLRFCFNFGWNIFVVFVLFLLSVIFAINISTLSLLQSTSSSTFVVIADAQDVERTLALSNIFN